MTTTNANGLEAHLQRALQAADRAVPGRLGGPEAAGGLAPPWPDAAPAAGTRSWRGSRSARDQFAATFRGIAEP